MASKAESEALARYWRQQIKAWKSSGQSRKAFCEQHDLNYHRFGYWHQKFHHPEQKISTAKRDAFVAVSVKASNEPTGLSVAFPGGMTLQGISAHNLPVVVQLLSHLS